MSYAFDWNVPDMDKPELKSPRPCKHGAGCNYSGSCGYVHPGEEGTGRQIFPARKFTDPRTGQERDQAACVRLIGNAGFYRRRQLKMTWPAWCAKQGITYVPNARVTTSAPGAPKKPRTQKPCSKCGHVEEAEGVARELTVADASGAMTAAMAAVVLDDDDAADMEE
jgi:hypothetical protein